MKKNRWNHLKRLKVWKTKISKQAKFEIYKAQTKKLTLSNWLHVYLNVFDCVSCYWVYAFSTLETVFFSLFSFFLKIFFPNF